MTLGAEDDQNLAATPINTVNLDETPPKVPLDLKPFALVSLLAPHLWPSQYNRLQFTVLLSLLVIGLGCIVNALAPLTLGALITTFNIPDVPPFPPYGSSPWPYLITYVVLTFLSSSGGLAALHYALRIPSMQYLDRIMSMRIFNHIMALSLSWRTKRKTGELLYMLDRGTAINRVSELIYFTVLPVFLNVTVAVIVFMIRFELSLGVVVGVAMAGYVWAGVVLTRYRTRVKKQMDDQGMIIRGIHTESLLNYQTVKYFGGDEHEARKYAEAIGEYQSLEKDFDLTFHFHSLAQTLLITLGFLVGSTIVASRIRRGKGSTSDFIVFITYYAQLYFSLSQLGDVYRSIDQGLIDAEKLLDLLAEPSELVDAPDAKELVVENGEVEFENVSFSYDDTTPALKNVSFKVPPGGRVVVVGEFGAGKSTILRLLYRLYKPGEGRILIDGQDIQTVTLSSLRNTIGLLPQDPVLFNASVGYNIAYGRPSTTLPPQSTITDAAQAAGIHERIMNFPEGYETKVGERGVRLSDREKQGVSIARTMVKNPKMLLLDCVLDDATERAALERLVDGRSCLSISHRLDTIKPTDVIIVLKEGRIVEQGSRKELSELGGLFASMWAADQINVSEELRMYEAPVVDVPEPENRGRWVAAPRAVRREDLGLPFIAPDSGSPVASSPLVFPTTTTTSNPSSVDGLGNPERFHAQGTGVTFDSGAISRAGSPEPGTGSGRRVAQGIQRLARRISVGGSNSKGLKPHNHGHHRETSVSSASGSGGVSPPVSTKRPESIEESHHAEKTKEEKRKKRGHLL